MIRLVRDGFRWEMQPDFASVLGPLLQQDGFVVKESPVKRVTRHEWEGRGYYVKRYRHEAAPWRALKFCFRASPARQEWRAAARLEAMGIPVVRHLAHGERWGVGLRESILITERFDGRPLDEEPGFDPALAVDLVERLHARGVYHFDLHSGNVLGNAASRELRLVDVDKVLFRTTPVPSEHDEMLAFLHISFPLPIAAPIRELSARRRRELLAVRSHRCRRHNREFAPHRAGGLQWYVRRPLLSPAVERILAGPDEFLRTRARLLKPGQTTTVGVGDGLVLKRFNLRKALNLLKDLARDSRALRAFQKAYHLELAGVPTARVVAATERRWCGLLLRSYVLMEEIPNAVTLQRHLRAGRAADPPLVRAAARLVARLHAEGFTHGDLNERNLVRGPKEQVFLIDLDALEFVGQVRAPAAARDLARLAADAACHKHLTSADRNLFLRTYCRARRLRTVPRLN